MSAARNESQVRRLVSALSWTTFGLFAALSMLWLARAVGWLEYSNQVWIVGAWIYFVSFSTAAVAERLPRGKHLAGARLMSAAFCRTILPLLALAGWAWYSSHSFSVNDGLVLAISYFIPFAIGIFLALRELPGVGD
ncbi:MAG TPA: hypothetical protein PKD54_05595 [Pirellulaceae bacterium]|nr:hypothetical protein [Pirellulaceae bacterium]